MVVEKTQFAAYSNVIVTTQNLIVFILLSFKKELGHLFSISWRTFYFILFWFAGSSKKG